jgi:hypothetical protein
MSLPSIDRYTLLLGILSVFLLTTAAQAITMTNDNYILQMGTLGSGGGKPTSGQYKVGISLGQVAPGLFSGTNYKVRSGFQYIHSIIAFQFAISETLIDFGIISPTNPVTRTNNLIVSSGSAFGYSVKAFENHELLATSGTTIPDTTCDNGSCSETTASEWSNTLTYGFGYRCDAVSGSDCPSGFSTDYYKQFANASTNETIQSVMSGLNVGRDKEVKITYKVNISGTQLAGVYKNRITYIATPTY